MVQVSYPGVYIDEVPSGVHTITGVSTSIAAFIGQAKEGPIDKAVRILNYGDFEKIFGPPHPNSEMATSMRLFFQNGGTDAYAIRVVKNDTGSKASLILKREAATPLKKDLNSLKFEAREIGVWGNEIAIDVDYNTNRPEDTFHLRIYRKSGDGTIKALEEYLNCSMDPDSPRFPPSFMEYESKLVNCQHTYTSKANYKAAATTKGYSLSRRPFADDAVIKTNLTVLIGTDEKYKFRISIDGGGFHDISLKDLDLKKIKTAGDIADKIEHEIDKYLPSTLAGKVVVSLKTISGEEYLKFESDTTEHKSINIQPASDFDLASELLLGTDQGGIEESRYAGLRPAPNGIFFDLDKLAKLSGTQQNFFNKITLDGNEINLETKLVTTASTDEWRKGRGTDYDGVREKFRIVASAINDEGIGWKASVAGSRLIIRKRSGLNRDLGAITTSLGNIGGSFLTNNRLSTLGLASGTYYGAKTAGAEGSQPDVANYKGSEDKHTGLHALDHVDIFNLLLIPRDENLGDDKRAQLWGYASAYCKAKRAFLLVEPSDKWTSYREAVDASIGIRKLRMGVVKDHSAVFFPKISISDNGMIKEVGSSGAIAGVMARIDSSRGVWKAPAGLEADIVGVSGVNVPLTDMENGVLNKEGISCIRSFPSGIVSWGARTMSGSDDMGSEWKYIPIRRLALFLEESLFRGTKWVVFAPNDEPLWAKIRLNVGSFMMRLFKQGAFQGSTPDKAFYVKCDGETTTAADRNLGIVNIEVGFAPLKPAEFVVIKIQQIPDVDV